ncbi:unknown protein [Desulfotalea psychrophila LSv54]|uniref:Uncharacterized protein n=1 Tax=Desulfotalea psychrophila (strain LSv54 / DSM 12343) TaxID=177439 RepID=Q6AR76_DESPS|nr:unknown protein [Desulfotalea psychrophila LSv54]
MPAKHMGFSLKKLHFPLFQLRQNIFEVRASSSFHPCNFIFPQKDPRLFLLPCPDCWYPVELWLLWSCRSSISLYFSWSLIIRGEGIGRNKFRHAVLTCVRCWLLRWYAGMVLFVIGKHRSN